MGDYYKVAATLPAPSPSGRDTTPKHPQTGKRPTAPGEVEPWQKQPDEPGWKRLDESAPPPYTEELPQQHRTLKAAEAKPSLRERCQKCERTLRHLLPLILLFFYTLLGGMIFHFVETQSQSPAEVAKGHLVLIDQPNAIQLEKRMTEIVLDSNYTREKRKHEVREALLWYLRQLTKEEQSRWDFASALFYSMTLYTTIGYGDTPPKTTAGKVLTVVYSIIGIPLALGALIEIGYLFGWTISKLWSCIKHGCAAICGRRSRRSNKHGDWETLPSSDSEKREDERQEAQDDADLLSFPLSSLILLTLLWILLTAALFYAWESPSKWSYAESLYFTFISFSTIGLGDYVPDTLWGKLAGIFFLLVGLALVSTTIAVLQQQLDALQNAMQRSIDAEYQDSQGGSGEPMATDDKSVDDGLKRMASQLPPGSRLLYCLMPEGKKKNLKKYYKKKAALVPKSMQTDDYLWAMTTMSKSFLKNVAQEKGSAYGDDAKSRDDVNSLVAMCDYSLPYDYGAKSNY